MAGMRLLCEEGFRGDGRKPNEIRHISGKLGVLKQAHGSAYFEQGDTKVLAAVYGPHGVRSGKGKSLHDQAIINCQFSMAVFSTSERKLRPRGDRKSIEVNQNLKQIFESAILVNLYPSQQIDIYIEVLQADGSVMAASVNAATLALADAGISLKGLVCASSSGSVDDMPIVDLNHTEESQSTFQLNMAMLPGVYDKIFMYHLNGRLHESQFDVATENTTKGCKEILKAMEHIIEH